MKTAIVSLLVLVAAIDASIDHYPFRQPPKSQNNENRDSIDPDNAWAPRDQMNIRIPHAGSVVPGRAVPEPYRAYRATRACDTIVQPMQPDLDRLDRSLEKLERLLEIIDRKLSNAVATSPTRIPDYSTDATRRTKHRAEVPDWLKN